MKPPNSIICICGEIRELATDEDLEAVKAEIRDHLAEQGLVKSCDEILEDARGYVGLHQFNGINEIDLARHRMALNRIGDPF